MVDFIVVDDNVLHRKRVNELIVSHMMGNKLDFKINTFNDYSDKLLSYIDNKGPQCVFILDLELPSGDGIDIARYIRNTLNDWFSPIIILTAHTSLYYEVYKQRLQILDFIGKCDSIEKNLNETIDIALQILNINKTYRFTYKNIDYSIPFKCINYVQRDGRKTKIVTIKDEYYLNKSINELKEEFPLYFKISSKGILLNTKNVLKIDWSTCNVIFKDKTYGYLVSKNHKKELDVNEND